MALPKMYTKQEAADYLRVNPKTISRHIEAKKLTCVKSGKFVLIPESAIAEYVRVNTIPAKKIQAA